MMSIQEMDAGIDDLIVRGGSYLFRTRAKLKMIERVNKARDKREQFNDRDKTRKWSEQQEPNGHCLCGICGKPMEMKLRRNGKPFFVNIAMDHIDVNRQDFNAWDNLQLAHDLPCNREKAAKNQTELSKHIQLHPTMGDEGLL